VQETEQGLAADMAPASFAQEWMWLLDRLNPGATAYNATNGIRIRGRLQLAALEEALERVVSRHDVLRTTFAMVDGELRQNVADRVNVKLATVHLSGNGSGDLEGRFEAAALAEVRRPFDLERGPLFRFAVLSAGDEQHAFVMMFHHTIVDQWSLRIIVKEVEALYGALAAGAPAPAFQPPTVRYADFARRQRETLRGATLERLLEYWRDELAGDLPLLELPTDRPRPAQRRLEGARSGVRIDPTLALRARELGRTEGASLLATMLAVFAVLLHRYSGQRDLVIGTPFSGRTQPEFEALVGCLINTLPLRIRIEPEATLRSLVRQVRSKLKRAIQFQELPLQAIVSELHIPRTASRPPVFQALFTRRNVIDGATATFGDLPATKMKLRAGGSHVDLTWSISGVESDLWAHVTYDVALFTRETADRMLGHFRTLLASAMEEPDREVASLALLSEDERRLLVDWSASSNADREARCIHQVFEAVAERTPDTIAVALGDEAVTYRELNARANRLARHLRALGVRAGTPVAVAVERSIDMVIAVVGILKAGGAYVPLDPSYPEERLRYLLADTAAPVVLTQRGLRARIPADAVTVALDDDGSFTSESAANLETDVHPGSAAYIMYTSGSTGKPKGVVIPHRAIARLVLGPNFVPFGPSLSIAQVSNFAFDAATFELWGALLNGSRLVIVPKDVLLSTTAFSSLLESARIGAMFLTSALFNQIVRTAPNAFRSVRYLIVGGESVDVRAVRMVLGAERPYKLINGYGPTETTTFACTFDCDDLEENATNVPIGRPIADTRVYVLDENRQPVPIGVTGELYVGGAGVALGYHNDAELTARSFVVDPFATDAPSHLYKTGDRVRFRPDGALEFLGRIDRQAKIRGFRIEPGEVEGALGRYPAVHESVVLVREDVPGQKRLIAYAVPREGAVVEAPALRAFLAEMLPAYMLPAETVVLERLPLTPNGKVDREALASTEHAVFARTAAAPATPAETLLEAQLVELFEEVLDIGGIGADDDFFALGGDSLRAALLVGKIHSVCGEAVPPHWLFEAPTPRALARRIGAAQPVSYSPLSRVQAGSKATPLFFLNGDLDGGGVYIRRLARALDPERTVYTLPPHGIHGTPALETVEEMAADYAALIQRTHPNGPYLLGGYCNGGVVAYEIARLLRGRGAHVGPLIMVASTAFNARVQALREVRAGIRWIGKVFRWSPEEELRWFRRVRVRAIALALLHGAPLSAYRAFAHEQLRRLTPGIERPVPLEAPEDAGRSRYHARIAAALVRYVPAPYEGPVHHIWGDEDEPRFRGDPTMGWGAVAPNLILHRSHGSHLTLATRAHELAAIMRPFLSEWE
jgi:amino acid adenylation domain-containing protein